MSLPLFDNITLLVLEEMLDAICTCRNLVSFSMRGYTLRTPRYSLDAIQNACERFRPCQKLITPEFLLVVRPPALSQHNLRHLTCE